MSGKLHNTIAAAVISAGLLVFGLILSSPIVPAFPTNGTLVEIAPSSVEEKNSNGASVVSKPPLQHVNGSRPTQSVNASSSSFLPRS